MNKRRRVLMVVALVIAALLVLPFIISVIVSLVPAAQAAVSQSDIDALKDNADVIAGKKKDLSKELSKLKDEKAGIVEQKALYDEQIALLNEEIENTTALMSELSVQIAQRNRALEAALQKQEEGLQQYEARLAAMQRMDDLTYLGVLLEAESFSDFLVRWENTGKLIEYDQKLAEEYRQACLTIEVEQAALEADRQEEALRRADLAASQSELAALCAEADAALREVLAEISDGEKALDEQERAEEEALQAVRKAQEDLKKQEEERRRREEEERRRREEEERKNNQEDNNDHSVTYDYVGGVYTWPLPGYTRISSGYGYRIHPVYGSRRFHSGLDIPAPKNTPIIAANAGIVITRAYNSGYGNYIVVDHGGGQATLYAHMNKFASYGVGSSVKKGATIGYVGTTGVSTGYHLHFSVLLNGNIVDPVPYLKG